MKKYKMIILWDDGEFFDLGNVKTNDPKRALFDKVCELIVTTNRFFNPNNPDKIWEGIKQGQKSKSLGFEHYYFEANGNVVSIMEAR